MENTEIPKWLSWARQLQRISQNGIHFAKNDFEKQRFQEISEIAADILGQFTQVSNEKWLDGFSTQQGYATPKVSVRGAVFRDHQILLVREKLDGLWSMPGGWADLNDPPSKMIEREVWEESGYEVRAQKLFAVHESNHDRAPLEYWHSYTLYFLCDLLGGRPNQNIETSACGFFNLQEIPPLSPMRTSLQNISESFYYLDHPEAFCIFD